MSSTQFQAILDAAIDSYAKQTGVDLAKHPSADKLQNCQFPEDVIHILLEREMAFNDYRHKYRKLIDCLRPVVQVVHGISGIIGEAASLVSPRHRDRILYIFKLPAQVPFQPTKAIFVSIDVLLSVRTVLFLLSHSSPSYLCDNADPCQAALGVSASYDALIDLTDCIANFLRRLHIYTEMTRLPSAMSGILVKIMAEVLAVFALATKQIKQGRFSKLLAAC
jgi:hypothetical protein